MDRIISSRSVQLCLRTRINGAKKTEKRKRERKNEESERKRDSDRAHVMVAECWALLSLPVDRHLHVIFSCDRRCFTNYNLRILW